MDIIFMMSLDKFGRSSAPRTSEVSNSPLLQVQRGFTFTEDGNIDIGNLRLCNVQLPTAEGDATTKAYVDLTAENLSSKVHTSNEAIGVLGKEINDINDQVKSSMNRIKELDQFLNVVILSDIRTLNEISILTGEKLTKTVSAWEDRIAKLNREIKEIKRTVNIT